VRSDPLTKKLSLLTKSQRNCPSHQKRRRPTTAPLQSRRPWFAFPLNMRQPSRPRRRAMPKKNRGRSHLLASRAQEQSASEYAASSAQISRMRDCRRFIYFNSNYKSIGVEPSYSKETRYSLGFSMSESTAKIYSPTQWPPRATGTRTFTLFEHRDGWCLRLLLSGIALPIR